MRTDSVASLPVSGGRVRVLPPLTLGGALVSSEALHLINENSTPLMERNFEQAILSPLVRRDALEVVRRQL